MRNNQSWSDADFEYISDKRFSNAKAFSINASFFQGGRLGLIDALVKDCSVLHVGCADHLELIEKKIGNNTWLHKRLISSAKIVYGIDIDSNAVKKMHELGYSDVECFDVTESWPGTMVGKEFDVAVLGEVVEHVSNPVDFLSGFCDASANSVGELIVTVPNAFSYFNFLNVLRGVEKINTDHKFFFTPYTISKVMSLAGWRVKAIYYVEDGVGRDNGRFRDFIKGFVLSKFPMLAVTMVVVAERD